jgi:ABC-2 type transport system permease protein
VLIEKEVRSLSRAPRFRLLFLMGFSFGLLIWLPLAMRGDPESTLRTNYLTVVSAYALMLLGETAFWNSFGMDRTAAQTYFVTPVPISAVLFAKNFASALFILLEVGMVAFFCLLLRMPVTVASAAEALAVTAVASLFLFSAGNMMSVRYAKGVDPAQSWRTSNAGRVQALLFILYPVMAGPVLLAYGARYAFEHELAFWGVLLLDVFAGAVVYHVALESAAGTAFQRKEDLVQSLSAAEGPVGG